MKLIANASTLFAFVILSGISHAQLAVGDSLPVNDSGFETPQMTFILGGDQVYSASQTFGDTTPNTTNWYVQSGTVSVVNSGLLGTVLGALIAPLTNTTYSGQYLALNSLAVGLGNLTPNNAGDVRQNIVTTPGYTYQVNYSAATLSLGVATTGATLQAGVVGNSTGSSGSLVALSIGSFSNQSFTFTANSALSTIEFFETTPLIANVGGAAIDNVSITVTAVPEPSHYAVILIGCVMAFSLMRRQLQKTNAFITRKSITI